MHAYTQAVVDAGTVMRVPEGFTTLEAAAFMEATLTAYLNIFQLGGAEKGKSVLIHGGGSGVGRCVVLCPPEIDGTAEVAQGCVFYNALHTCYC